MSKSKDVVTLFPKGTIVIYKGIQYKILQDTPCTPNSFFLFNNVNDEGDIKKVKFK